MGDLGTGGSRQLTSERRLRVLVYTTLFPNSVMPLHGNFVLERMRHMHPYADISVVAPVPYFPRLKLNERWFRFSGVPQSERIHGFDVDHPRYLVIPRLGMTTHGVSMFLGSFRRVVRRLRLEAFDLIDAHYVYPDGLAAVKLGAALGRPVVVSARGTDINVFAEMSLIRPLVKQALQRADALIAVSRSLRDRMVRLGCDANKIRVIGNGVDAVKFSFRSASRARRELGLPRDRSIVLSVGTLLELKRFDILIRAVSALRAEIPRVLLVIVGEGPERGKLEQLIRDLRVESHVILAGAVPHERLSEWYNASDVFCLASSREGLPNVVLEAMACGKPVVATAVGGIPEIIVSPRLGRLVAASPEAFESSLKETLASPWAPEAIVRHASSYDWNRVAREISDVYSEVLDRRLVSSAARQTAPCP